MWIDCPKCERNIDLTDCDMPTATDDANVECVCGHEFTVGWYAVPEIRDANI